MARLKKEFDENEYAKLEGMMWILPKQHKCLSEADKDKLQLLYHCSSTLKKALRYALKLTQIFNTHKGYFWICRDTNAMLARFLQNGRRAKIDASKK